VVNGGDDMTSKLYLIKLTDLVTLIWCESF
jgi:hypothetical protein